MNEWTEPAFIREQIEEQENSLEREWRNRPGRWANLLWDQALTPMQESFEEKFGALPEMPMLKDLKIWEQALLRRFWLERLQDEPKRTPPVQELPEMSAEQVEKMQNFLLEAVAQIRAVKLDRTDKEQLSQL